jgi:hypothetical protein
MAPPHVDERQSVRTAASEVKDTTWIPIQEKGLFTPRKIRIVTVGAGYSGLMLAYKIRNQFKYEDFIEHVIYEKNVGFKDIPEVGETNEVLLARHWRNMA